MLVKGEVAEHSFFFTQNLQEVHFSVDEFVFQKLNSDEN
jgi:hypothetical protein